MFSQTGKQIRVMHIHEISIGRQCVNNCIMPLWCNHHPFPDPGYVSYFNPKEMMPDELSNKKRSQNLYFFPSSCDSICKFRQEIVLRCLSIGTICDESIRLAVWRLQKKINCCQLEVSCSLMSCFCSAMLWYSGSQIISLKKFAILTLMLEFVSGSEQSDCIMQ